jgi:hypothetical protein
MVMYQEIKNKIHSGIEKNGCGQEIITMELMGSYWPKEQRKLDHRLSRKLESNIKNTLKRIYVDELLELIGIERCYY